MISNHRMLLVEDDLAIQQGVVFLLRKQGYEVITAATVREGLDQLVCTPSHILLDASLPDGVGTSILRHIRAEGLPIKVAILSGWGNDALLMAGECQPDAMFTKPPNWDAVLDWINA